MYRTQNTVIKASGSGVKLELITNSTKPIELLVKRLQSLGIKGIVNVRINRNRFTLHL